MFQPIFTTIFKRRDTAIFLAFSSLPLLVSLAAHAGVSLTFNQQSMKSFLSYLTAMLDFQLNIFLPMLIFAFVVASVFREDIESGRLFLFKDLPKRSIFSAKMGSLFAVYGLYLLLTVLFSAISYFALLGGGQLFPLGLDILSYLLKIVVIAGLHLTTITSLAYFAIQKKTLFAVLLGLFVYMFTLTMPVWFGLQILAPGYYVQGLTQGNIGFTILCVTVLLLVYILPVYMLASKKFQNIQF